jgi:tryptophan synthase beta chain
MDRSRFLLDEAESPATWYNLAADLPGPALAPALNPATRQPLTRDEMAHTMPEPLIDQELSTDREIEIPEPVRRLYALWRPSALHRARRLERELDTPARIYYKYEGTAPTGSHKPNTGIPQAYYNKLAGKTGLSPRRVPVNGGVRRRSAPRSSE